MNPRDLSNGELAAQLRLLCQTASDTTHAVAEEAARRLVLLEIVVNGMRRTEEETREQLKELAISAALLTKLGSRLE